MNTTEMKEWSLLYIREWWQVGDHIRDHVGDQVRAHVYAKLWEETP